MRLPARLVVGTGADELPRALGPAAWAALEVLAARSHGGDGDPHVAMSVRQVAATLGLSKNAGHRAVRRLVDSGLIAATQIRLADGRFHTGTYRLDIPADALCRPDEPHVTVDTAPPRRRRLTDRSLQLDLLSDCD